MQNQSIANLQRWNEDQEGDGTPHGSQFNQSNYMSLLNQ
jgi:hypothetical protein